MRLFGVYGASGHGREVMPLLRHQVKDSQNARCVFIDDSVEAPTQVNGHDCMSFEDFCGISAESHSVIIAIGNGQIRKILLEKCLAARLSILDVKAANSIVMDNVEIAQGSLLCSFTSVTSNVSIGRQFQANIHSHIAHDCVIGDFVTLAPGVICNGNVHIEDEAYIGAGAILKQGTSKAPLVIGAGAVVGMGAVVTRSVPPNTTVVGNPAKPIKKD